MDYPELKVKRCSRVKDCCMQQTAGVRIYETTPISSIGVLSRIVSCSAGSHLPITDTINTEPEDFDLFVGGDVELLADGAERFKKRSIKQD